MMERTVRAQRRAAYLRLVASAVAVVVLIGLAFGVKDLRSIARESRDAQVEQRRVSAASRQQRLEYQGDVRFTLCSRDPGKTVLPERAAELEASCEGYETRAAALRSERRKQAEAEKANR